MSCDVSAIFFSNLASTSHTTRFLGVEVENYHSMYSCHKNYLENKVPGIRTSPNVPITFVLQFLRLLENDELKIVNLGLIFLGYQFLQLFIYDLT